MVSARFIRSSTTPVSSCVSMFWPSLRRFFLLLVVLCPLDLAAQAEFSGIYFGTFSGTRDNGQFAIFARPEGTAILAAYDSVDEDGFVNEFVQINPDGSFSKTNVDGQGTSVSGQFAGTTVTGSFVVIDGSVGSFSGSKVSNIGFLRTAGGYYTGLLSGVVSVGGSIQYFTSGSNFAIVAANGAGFVFGSASGGGETAESGGFFNVNSSGVLSGTLLDGTVVNGTVNTAALTVTGTFSVSTASGGFVVVHSGSFSGSRETSLPNRAPSASDVIYTLSPNQSLLVDAVSGVLANDSDPDSDPIAASLVSGPSNGSLVLNSNGGFTYTPNAGFGGSDTFSYRATDGLAVSNVATVSILNTASVLQIINSILFEE